MGLTIPESVIQQAEMSPSELLLELATFLFFRKKLTLMQASKLAGVSQMRFQQAIVAWNQAEFQLTPSGEAAKDTQRKPGWGKDIFKYVSPDFDETPEGFEDYVPS